MDSTMSTPLVQPAPAATSPHQPPRATLDPLTSPATDPLLASQPSQSQPHPSALAGDVGSPYQLPSVDDQALLSAQYSELMAQNELLAKENRLFDSFLQRNAAAALEHDKSPKHGRRDKNRQQVELTLSDLDRNRLAVDELAYRTRQLSSLQQKSTSDLALLRSISLNMQLRQQELKKQAFEFQREVVMHSKQRSSPAAAAATASAGHANATKQREASSDGAGGADGSTSAAGGGGGGDGGGVTSEVLLRFLSDQIKDKHNLIKKLTIKIRHQKSTLHHMHQQLKQKEEQGDSLHSIDFHQLQIKNSQYNSKIKDKNEQLLTLKSGAGIAVNRLNSMKKLLSDEMNQNKSIKKNMKFKHEMIDKMTVEMDKVETEIKLETNKQNKLRQVQSNPDMPHVMDYVRQKMEYETLNELNVNWDRKIEIAQMIHVPPNSIRTQDQRSQYQKQQSLRQAGLRREQEEKEQLRSLNVAAGAVMFPGMSQQ